MKMKWNRFRTMKWNSRCPSRSAKRQANRTRPQPPRQRQRRAWAKRPNQRAASRATNQASLSSKQPIKLLIKWTPTARTQRPTRRKTTSPALTWARPKLTLNRPRTICLIMTTAAMKTPPRRALKLLLLDPPAKRNHPRPLRKKNPMSARNKLAILSQLAKKENKLTFFFWLKMNIFLCK